MEEMLRHMQDHKAIQDSQHSFTKGRSCVINLVAFCNGVMMVIDGGSRKSN